MLATQFSAFVMFAGKFQIFTTIAFEFMALKPYITSIYKHLKLKAVYLIKDGIKDVLFSKTKIQKKI